MSHGFLVVRSKNGILMCIQEDEKSQVVNKIFNFNQFWREKNLNNLHFNLIFIDIVTCGVFQ